MEIIELLFYLVLAIIGRRRKPVPCVFDCPDCKTIRAAMLQETTTFGKGMKPVGGAREIRCGTCRHAFDAEQFEADASGVYTLKKWDCPHCGHVNANSIYTCTQCHYSLA